MLSTSARALTLQPGWLQELERQLGITRTELVEAQELRAEVEALADEELLQEADLTVAALQVRACLHPFSAVCQPGASLSVTPISSKQAAVAPIRPSAAIRPAKVAEST